MEDTDIGRFYVDVISPISLDCENSSLSQPPDPRLIFVSINFLYYLIVVITIGDSKHGLLFKAIVLPHPPTHLPNNKV